MAAIGVKEVYKELFRKAVIISIAGEQLTKALWYFVAQAAHLRILLAEPRFILSA